MVWACDRLFGHRHRRYDGSSKWQHTMEPDGRSVRAFRRYGVGASSVLIRCSRLATIPSSCTLFYQLATTALILLLIGLMLGETTVQLTTVLVMSLTFQTVIVAF